MQKRIIFLLVILSVCSSTSYTQPAGNPSGFLKGYDKALKGGSFSYHSPQPNVTAALLVRSIEKDLYIEWETEEVPASYTGKQARFIFLAAMDVNRDNPHSWDLYVNDRKEFRLSSPSDNSSGYYKWSGATGYNLEFRIAMTDQHGDQHGYMILTAPEGYFERGKPLKLKAIGESANSPTWFMVFRYGMEPELKLVEEQAVIREAGEMFQQVRIEYVYMGEPAEAVITSGSLKTTAKLTFGYNTIRAKVPVVKSPQKYHVAVSLQKRKAILAENDFILNPVIPRTIHLLHHSHVDIGYTHVQDEVKMIQWKNLEDAIRLADESKNYPDGARFRWNSEVMWPVETYLRENTPEKAKVLKDAISKGWIGLDAFYANELTELCTTEELIQLLSSARSVSSECGARAQSAMITDIPGWSWGIVPVLARSGVKYLSLGTNAGHRIGGTIREWGDRPFYWVSPSGEEKILCWIHEKAYSLFHTGLKYSELKFRLDEKKIFGYMNDLIEKDYPYEIVTLRYNIGSDNGPADATLSDAVKIWNEKYVTPVVKIMTVAGSFAEFEKRYGDRIPSVSGAFTGYWEDGAASSAAETAVNRKAASNIALSTALSVINDNKGYNIIKNGDAWRNVLLFNEHTWGSWNSISEPDNPFTLSQWENKREFALNALALSRELVSESLPQEKSGSDKAAAGIEVINTHSWPVSDLVEIPVTSDSIITSVADCNGKISPVQKLSTGKYVFVAKDIPPFGSKIFRMIKGNSQPVSIKQTGNLIETGNIILRTDSVTGSVSSLILKRKGIELVDSKEIPGLNTYYYVAGRSSSGRHTAGSSRSEITDNGPVTSVIRTVSEAEGVRGITSTYQLIDGLDKVVITTITDKEKVRTPEGVHLAFPFRIPDGVMRIDLAFGSYRPEADQIEAACKNYLTPEKWVDLSNQEYGLTWVTNDAPLIEIGEITTDATAYGWIEHLKPSNTIYSYVMNNYWETNYKADQEGPVKFRYTIHPHGMFIAADAEKRAIEENEPLVVIPVSGECKEKASLFILKSDAVIVSSLIPAEGGYIIRLFNAGGNPSSVDVDFRDNPADLYFCDFDGNKISGYTGGTIIPAWGIRNLRVRK